MVYDPALLVSVKLYNPFLSVVPVIFFDGADIVRVAPTTGPPVFLFVMCIVMLVFWQYEGPGDRPIAIFSLCGGAPPSHALPTPFLFESFWSEFEVDGQLSQTSPIVSPSLSDWFTFEVLMQLSQASPMASLSMSDWFRFGIDGQLSHTPGIESLSMSAPVGSPAVHESSTFPSTQDVDPADAHIPMLHEVGSGTYPSSVWPLQLLSSPSQLSSVPAGDPATQLSTTFPSTHEVCPSDAHTPSPQVVCSD